MLRDSSVLQRLLLRMYSNCSERQSLDLGGFKSVVTFRIGKWEKKERFWLQGGNQGEGAPSHSLKRCIWVSLNSPCAPQDLPCKEVRGEQLPGKGSQICEDKREKTTPSLGDPVPSSWCPTSPAAVLKGIAPGGRQGHCTRSKLLRYYYLKIQIYYKYYYYIIT